MVLEALAEDGLELEEEEEVEHIDRRCYLDDQLEIGGVVLEGLVKDGFATGHH